MTSSLGRPFSGIGVCGKTAAATPAFLADEAPPSYYELISSRSHQMMAWGSVYASSP